MRTVTYGAACTLDGFIADESGGYDWIQSSKGATEIMANYWKTIDTLLMGRKTWEVAAQAQGHGRSPTYGLKGYVFSRTLTESPHRDVELVSSDPGAFVRDLKREKGKGICVFGGGEFARVLFAADVIDEVGANIHPILLGSGIPLFQNAGRRIRLKLKEARPLGGGCAYVLYSVVHTRVRVPKGR
jgi:dihydrofolate reductase